MAEDKEILRTLNIIMKLTAMNAGIGLTATEKIKLLNNLGLRAEEIAEVIGTSKNTVQVRLSEMRKKKVKK